MDIVKVSNAIDLLLNKSKWSRKEYAFYQMLSEKVKQYQPEPKPKPKPAPIPSRRSPTQSIVNDINDIRSNIVNQYWYKISHNQGTINDLLQNMTINNCIYKNSGDRDKDIDPRYRYRLNLKLSSSINLILDVARAQHDFNFRVYYERGDIKGHIAAYTPGKKHQLPEYDHLKKIFPNLLRHEYVCLAIEIVLYYDVDGLMATLPLGNGHQITLSQLMNATACAS